MPSSDGLVLEARGLSRSFGRMRVLRDVDLTLAAGEALAVAGPNGAGKTTLLRLLAGLMRPSAGEIRVLGRQLTRGSGETRRALGLVSHQSLLYDDLTLLENLIFAARLYGLPHPRDAALAALESAGLAGRAGESPRRLSRGLAQRAAIARALLHGPRVLLMDEPFTALDAAAADRLREELRRRLAGGLGLVVVTHHLSEVWPVANRVAVLVEGRWASDEPRTGPLDGFLPRYHGLIGA
ncbi:MAG: heme ABC exporter ATP-binding protein CcmA [Gemmatimonadales bacterium]|nr:heme ABC exporter ATP-binding protein CcmA [Gemmatimonadales bacterium]MBA3554219.1 heme ABC exporter ATP-binding protein CcmA [Gemmatimonadales bacterium]